MAKNFFYGTSGVLLLVLAVHLSSGEARSQGGGLLSVGGLAGTRGELHASGVDASLRAVPRCCSQRIEVLLTD